MRRLLLLILGTLLLWILTALPVRALAEDEAEARQVVVLSGVAFLLCLLPTGLTLYLGRRALERAPQELPLAALGGTGLRLFSVLTMGLILTRMNAYLSEPVFWRWLLVAYLTTLALEMTLLLTGLPAISPAATTSSSETQERVNVS